MKIELSEKAKKEIEELEEKLFGHYTKEEREFFKTIRSTCEFYLYQVYEMEHLDRKGKRDWIKRLVESKVKEERVNIIGDLVMYSNHLKQNYQIGSMSPFHMLVGRINAQEKKDCVKLGSDE